MNPRYYLLLLLTLALAATACHRSEDTEIERPDRYVLLVRDTVAPLSPFDSILLVSLENMARDSQILLAPFSDSMQMNEENLKYYSSVVLLPFVEDSLRLWQRTALERYVEAGGGIVTADDPKIMPYLWHWYEELLQKDFPSADTTAINPVFETFNYAGGRVARFDQCYSQKPDTALGTNVRKAIEFTIGANSIDYGKVQQPLAPEFSQFTRIVLDEDLYEPMEMEILPFGEVLFLERRGKMKLYDPTTEKTKVVAEFDVCTEGNYEDGLHGLALDPGYGRDNFYIYLYYSPPCDTLYQYLSRFVFKHQQLERDSEIVMLRVGVQRETCCHSGGSLEFGPDSLLYLSTGDNTSSKESDGFTPIDERPGRGPFDAQKSSGNTHDLRGKIIRIRPMPDGTYTVPDGNLFPKDGSRGRPEIYAMGCRNPFRITIDPRHNILYWGDVGPDGGEDGRYGPKSYDEYNQARTPGYYGWPYFVGNNKGYPYRNFATDSVGLVQDPVHPHNYSPNNYGSHDLPPARPAMIWYAYQPEPPFQILGAGSRAAMAGPFYYADGIMPLSTVNFPSYYEGKWFIYEWARSWIKVVTFDSLQRPIQIEPFAPQMALSKPIDMKFGPNGALYILEYGNSYFLDNPDARLVKLEFAAGNRPPKARIAVTDPAGAAPHTATFSAAASFDYDRKDSLCYEWFFDRYDEPQSTDAEAHYTFNQPGHYKVILRVIDDLGEVDEIATTIQVGNAAPVIALESERNRSFYFGAGAWPYHLKITDEEDAQSTEGVGTDRALVSYTYVTDYNLRRDLITGKAQLPEGPIEFLENARLIKGSDCYSCHNEELTNVGPAFKNVAARYPATEANIDRLAHKVIAGGNGNWGEAMMSAHPQLDLATTRKMVQYVLSLNDAGRLPLNGSLNFNKHLNSDTLGLYILSATYKDQGSGEYDPVTTRLINIIRPPLVEVEQANEVVGGHVPIGDEWGAFRQVNLKAGGYFRLDKIDLRGINGVNVKLIHAKSGRLELRLDKPTGPAVATANLTPPGENPDWKEVRLAIPPTNGMHDLYFVFEGDQDYEVLSDGRKKAKDMCAVDWAQFEGK